MATRIIIKLGTNLLFDGTKVRHSAVRQITSQIASLRQEVIIVASGAVALGNLQLKAKFKHEDDVMRNVAAGMGQIELSKAYKELLPNAAQVLITKNDLMNRESFLQIKAVLEEMLKNSIIPLVNENDAIKTRTLKFQDNDELAMEIASKMEADLLIILTNVAGVFSSDPRTDEDAKLLTEVSREKMNEIGIGRKQSSSSTGGMEAKLQSALMAAKIGIPVVIANGNEPGVIKKILDGQNLGTSIKAEDAVRSKLRWILLTKEKGTLIVDEGAASALRQEKSLLAAGVKEVIGDFLSDDVVAISSSGKVMAKAIVEHTSDMLRLIKGKKTDEIRAMLKGYNCVARHENVALVK